MEWQAAQEASPMSASARSYIPAPDFLEAHRDPITGRRLISREALYLGVKQGRIPHVRLGRRILVPSDLLDQLVTKPASAASPLTSDAA